MPTLEVYYENGDYDSFSSTVLPFGDGYLLENERIILDVNTILEDGIIWERDFFASEEEDPEQDGKIIHRMQIVKPAELEKVALIALNGKPYIAREDDELKFIFFDNEQKEELEDFDDGEE